MFSGVTDIKTFEKIRLFFEKKKQQNNVDNTIIKILELLYYTDCMLEPIFTYLQISPFGVKFGTPFIYTQERVVFVKWKD